MRQKTEGSNGWYRLGRLLIKPGHLDKVEEVYMALLHQTKSDDSEKAYLYNQFGAIKDDEGDYVTAISFYEKSLELFEKTPTQ
jgi:tetratricopeptide (TPR) repeat protein